MTDTITTDDLRASYEEALRHENALTDRISTDDFSARYEDPPAWAIGPFTRDPSMTFRQPAVWDDPTGIGWTSESVYNPTLGIDDGTLHLVYRASPRKESTSSRIGHAVLTPDGWVDDGGPILWPTLPNEALGVEDPKLYRAEGRWYCFYNGIWTTPDGTTGVDVLLAVSDDLVHWEKLGLVVPHAVSRLWAKGAVIPRNDRGEAVRIGGEYLMYLSEGCGGQLTVGRSDDMVHWAFAPEDYLDVSALGPELYEVACAVVDGDRLVLDFFHRDRAGAFAAGQARYALDAPFTQLELHPGGSLAWGGLLRWEGDRVFAQGWDAPRGSREMYFYREDHHV
jgi:beta-1,2-mannosidase